MSARWNENRKIARRILVKGKLTLLTPARFGGSEESAVTSMPILRDADTNTPLLPGSSIAGAMRAYLRERKYGYEAEETKGFSLLSQKLFGTVVDGDQGESRESYLLIEDALADKTATEFRPGVSIDSATRIVKKSEDKGQLYEMEMLEAGTSFELNFELNLPENDNEQKELLEAFAIALTGFETGEIGMGARKRRGFGECQVNEWNVQIYDLKKPVELISWIKGDDKKSADGKNIAEKLGVTQSLPDNRHRFKLEAEFCLSGSLLIRSGGNDPEDPDMVHLRSKHNGAGDTPILSGTSLAGIMRARGLRIANTLNLPQAQKFVSEIFGPDSDEMKRLMERKNDDQPFASRLLVRERKVEGKQDMVQSRIRIDRFSGGTLPGALFEQQPVIGGSKSKVTVSIELRFPKAKEQKQFEANKKQFEAQIGLLLHILKDLWTGDLALGGESSTGRGRLEGIKADLYLFQPNQGKREWHITPENDGKLHIDGDRSMLNEYAKSVGGAQ
jgi:CRISPR/Cas system CSM-associated protein Csm3 (group 7 of RAMP superfamily)